MNIKKWLSKNCESLCGKKVVVTGATGGLGKEICFLLARLEAEIVLACRNVEKAEALVVEIEKRFPNTKTDIVALDLNNLESVKNCVNELKKYNGIDILINNAAIYNVPLKKGQSGFNNIFEVNFVNTYYLTKQLLPELEKKEKAVCITVGSIAHKFAKLNRQDIDFSQNGKSSKVYGNSKRFLMFSFYELFKNTKVKLSIVHPGITYTNMTSHYHWSINWFVKFGVKLIFPKPKNAALNVLFGRNHYTTLGMVIGPSVFDIWGKPKLKKLRTFSEEESVEIQRIAEEIVRQQK